jgi:ABC-type transport system substrate-binding protein
MTMERRTADGGERNRTAIPAGALVWFGLVLSLLLVGCDTNPHPAPLHKTRPDGSPWIVRYAYLADDPRGLDPQHAYDQMSHRIQEAVLDTLLEYQPMKTDPFELVPALLTAMPERTTHEDGSVEYLCRLKLDIHYQDDPCFPGGKGREVVAEDVHFAWLRMSDPKVECPIFATLEPVVPGMHDLYEAAKKAGKFDYSARLAGLEVLDPHTFKIRLSQPYPQIIYWLAMQFTTPVPREAVEYYDGKKHPGEKEQRPEFNWHPVGTGPFRIAEYEEAHRFRLVRNPDYRTTVFPSDGFPPEKAEWLKQFAGRKLPLVDEIEWPILRETQTMWQLARQGYFDGTAVAKDSFGRIVTTAGGISPDLKARGMTLEKDTELGTFFISFNCADPVLANVKLRKALACAYNPQAYCDIFKNGVSPVATQLVPPGIFGHLKDWKNPNAYNLERARQLIAEAGYPNGIDPKTGKPLELSMDVTATGSEERQTAEFEQRCFEALGIKIKVIENTFAKMLDKQEKGLFQIAPSTGWGADYPDPENFFFLFYSKNIPPAGKNESRYVSAEFDRIFEKMALMDNGPERLELCRRLNEILAEDCPCSFNFHKAYYVVVQPWARRTQSNMMLEGGLKYAQVDPVMRARAWHEWNHPIYWPLGAVAVAIAGAVRYAVRWNRRLNA